MKHGGATRLQDFLGGLGGPVVKVLGGAIKAVEATSRTGDIEFVFQIQIQLEPRLRPLSKGLPLGCVSGQKTPDVLQQELSFLLEGINKRVHDTSLGLSRVEKMVKMLEHVLLHINEFGRILSWAEMFPGETHDIEDKLPFADERVLNSVDYPFRADSKWLPYAPFIINRSHELVAAGEKWTPQFRQGFRWIRLL